MQIKNQKDALLNQIDEMYPKAAQAKAKAAKIQLLNELEAIEKKYFGKSVRASLFQLGKINSNDFNPTVKTLLRHNCLVEVSYLIETNYNALERGKLYEVEVENTDKNIAAHAEWTEKNRQAAEMEAEVGAEVANTIKAIGQAAKAKVKAPAKDQKTLKAEAVATAEQEYADAVEANDQEAIAEAKGKLKALGINKK